jgi:hypothetical protein
MKKTHMFYVFRVVAATIYGKMVPVQFETQAQSFGDLSLLPLSRNDEGRQNMLGWATVQIRHRLLQIFLLSLSTKKTPSDKTVL